MTDRFVDGAGVRIATRDHGGDGPPLLLIHGAGRTLADFGSMAPVLTASHRVVAMDLRGHGRSDDGGWAWGDVLADVRAVVGDYDLERPAIAGHSLGGMIAAMYAEHDDCRAAINIDGHGQGRPEHYVGFEPAEVEERFGQLKTFSEGMLQGMRAPLTAEAMEEGRIAARAQAEAHAIDPDLAVEAFERGLQVQPDGTYLRKPAGTTTEPMFAALQDLDLFALYRRVRCPLLIYNAVAPEAAATMSGAPEWLGSLMAGYREGLRRNLSSLAEAEPHVSVQEIDATHMLILDHAQLVADQVVSFLDRA